MDEYFVAISINKGDVQAKEWFHSLLDARKWAEDYEGTEYTVTIYKNAETKPFLKYDKKSLF